MKVLSFYLIFGAIIIEIVKLIRQELKKSVAVSSIQLFILALSTLIIIEFSASIVFALVPILIAAVVVFNLVSLKQKLTITQKFIMIFCLILSGVVLVLYGMVKT